MISNEQFTLIYSFFFYKKTVENVMVNNYSILRYSMSAIISNVYEVCVWLSCDLQTIHQRCHRQHIVNTQILSEFKILTEFKTQNMNVRSRIFCSVPLYFVLVCNLLLTVNHNTHNFHIYKSTFFFMLSLRQCTLSTLYAFNKYWWLYKNFWHNNVN